MDGMPIISVTDLMWKLKDTVEAQFPWVCVQGELSNVTYARSGHVYFTLKDDRSEIRGVVWSRTAAGMKFKLKDGLQILATGPVEVYAARGSVQLIVEHVIPQGMGELELAFRQLQQKLQKEGLFEREHKQPLPRFPKRIAIITSPTGAAVRDVLKVLTRRWRAADVILLPTQVQGPNAAGQIARAIKRAGTLRDVDVIIAGRGGGSLEDLWAFNEEVVARAIFESPVPIISAVGHEVDVSIADLVADARAATPTDAGQMVVPDRHDVAGYLDGAATRLRKALLNKLTASRARLASVESRRVLARPLDRIHEHTAHVDALAARLIRAGRNRVESARNRITQASRQLDALSPLKVLSRGYSITEHTDVESRSVVRSINDVKVGDTIRTRVADGEIVSQVSSTEAKETDA
jgi:exodeoxyribonuclease VII large subunit